ncbi:hypothetical protein B0H10DRAFT_2045728 [Mycena sp. CBHHK59/15]|nr:hypothetical protein B0H10DRAFT_2045728 [Mycena sp. CBHHK59/15]
MSDVSGILGQYMLKGWVLTDRTCSTVGCSVPLMRSPTGKTPVVHFCASCDGSPDIRPPLQMPDSSASISSSSHISRSSTPPTEISSALSSPVFAPPAETEESRRRREQSDAARLSHWPTASQGEQFGWAMLADECPNTRCFGVPLVRPPKAGGEKDPRKECVICGTVYVTEVDWAGRERLVPENSGKHRSAPDIVNKGKAYIDEIPVQKLALERISSDLPQVNNRAPPTASGSTATTARPNTLLSTLDESSQGLESLSTDTASIGAVADAVSKVVHALTQVKQLQWAEKHTGETI